MSKTLLIINRLLTFLIVFTCFSQFSLADSLQNRLTLTASYVTANEPTLQYQMVNPTDLQILPNTNTTVNDRRTFILNPMKHAQEYLGVGSSLEEASVHNFMVLASPKDRDAILNKLFSNGEQSFNWNLVRITFGTSDFTPRLDQAPYYYTYDDNNGNPDPSLDHFNIDIGLESKKIELIKQVMAIKQSQQTDLLLYGSAWSPPAWMKKSDPNNKYESENKKIIDPITKAVVDNKLIGGMLDARYIPALAGYYTKTLLAYQKNGINFYAMSEINEPCVGQVAFVNYPNTCIIPEDAKTLLLAMKMNFKTVGLNTKIWLNDFNFGNEYGILNTIDNDSKKALDGIAFHGYYGSTEDLKNVLNLPYLGNNQPGPDGKKSYKGVYMSEYMTGWFWKGRELHDVPRIYDATRLIEYFHQGSSSYINWVTLKDERMGLLSGALINADGTLVNDPWYTPNSVYTKDGSVYSFDFMDYALGAIAKFVTSGGNDQSMRNAYVLADIDGFNRFYDPAFEKPTTPYIPTNFIDANPENLPKVSQISFVNPDYTLVTVVVNADDKPNDIRIVFPDRGNKQYQILATVPAQSIETFKLSGL